MASENLLTDAPADTSTTYELMLSEEGPNMFNGKLDGNSDQDWVRISLRAGYTYTITVGGDPANGRLNDSVLSLYDADGNMIDSNDDVDGAAGNLGSELAFSPEADGVYYLAVSANSFGSADDGKYSLKVTEESAAINENGTPKADKIYGGPLDDNIVGGEGNDVLTGGGGNDELSGGPGNDYLHGGPGADNIDGGEGEEARFGGDTVSYDGSMMGVTIDLGAGTASGGDADGDMLKNIENVMGSTYADTLTGDAGNNILYGLGGADTLSGGMGQDTISYAGSASGVMVNLATRVLTGGDAEGDVLAGDDVVTYTELEDADNDPATPPTPVMNDDGTTRDFTATVADIERVFGSAHDDVIVGNAKNNWIKGGAGDDRLYGGANPAAQVGVAIRGIENNDQLFGDAGNDHLYGGSGTDRLSGGSGDDWLQGGQGDDGEMKAGEFIDASGLSGGAGNDIVYGGVGDDFLKGDAGEDSLYGGPGNDAVRGGAGNDRLQGGHGNDDLRGGAGDDVMYGGRGADYFEGGDGDDTFYVDVDDAALSVDTLAVIMDEGRFVHRMLEGRYSITVAASNGGKGTDTVDFSSTAAQYDVHLNLRQDAEGVEIVMAGSGDDYLDALSKQKTGVMLYGGAGDDKLTGGSGADMLDGGADRDELTGGAGDDMLIGGADNDKLYGNGGNDILVGGPGRDTLDGGDGVDGSDSDTADYSASNAAVEIDLGNMGSDGYVQGAGGHASRDMLKNIENLVGSAYNDVLTGQDNANNRLEGGAGADELDGGEGTGANTLVYGSSTAGVVVNLKTGGAAGGHAQGDTIGMWDHDDEPDTPNIATFTHLEGSAYADQLTGNDGNNKITGGAGADMIDGGDGTDQATYEGGGVTVNLNKSGSVSGGDAEGDQLSNIEEILLKAPGPREAANTVMYASDVIVLTDPEDNGRALKLGGAEWVLSGSAVHSFENAEGGVDVNLGANEGTGTVADLDADNNPAVNLPNVAATDIIGSAHDDKLTGDEQPNTLTGGGGNDNIQGEGDDDTLHGGAGDDRINGGAGDDTIHGGAGNDESLRGGAGKDTIHGGAGDDDLESGNSTNTGNDMIYGGAGNDYMENHGRSGADYFVFGLDDGDDKIGDWQDGDKIWIVGDISEADLVAGIRATRDHGVVINAGDTRIEIENININTFVNNNSTPSDRSDDRLMGTIQLFATAEEAMTAANEDMMDGGLGLGYNLDLSDLMIA